MNYFLPWKNVDAKRRCNQIRTLHPKHINFRNNIMPREFRGWKSWQENFWKTSWRRYLVSSGVDVVVAIAVAAINMASSSRIFLWIVMDSVCSGRSLCMLNSLIKSYIQWNRKFPLFKMLNLSCIFYSIYVFKFNSMDKTQLKTWAQPWDECSMGV